MNIQTLIDTIMSEFKHGAESELGSKIYKDEPILMTAAQMKSYTPPRYREMRKLAKGGIYYEHDERTFYEQARFMESFEDDFIYQGEFVRYYPTYQSMNDQELRGYFSWRTKLRHGSIEKTSRSFVFVYIYELLNQIGVESPSDGYQTLKTFWQTYRAIDPMIDRYVKLWLKDYIIYNDLDKAYLEPLVETGFDSALLILLHYEAHTAGEIMEALTSLASYGPGKSSFFKQYPEDVTEVVSGVFAALSAYYAKNRKYNLCEKFFGRMTVEYYSMFPSAVFYNRAKHGDSVYEINEIHKYRCEKGRWTCERYVWKDAKRQQVKALLKAIDYRMRQKYQFKPALKEVDTTKLFAEVIDKEIERVLEEKRKKARPKIEIDVSKLQEIRRTALKTQSRLIVDEAAEGAKRKAADTVTEGLSEGKKGLFEGKEGLSESVEGAYESAAAEQISMSMERLLPKDGAGLPEIRRVGPGSHTARMKIDATGHECNAAGPEYNAVGVECNAVGPEYNAVGVECNAAGPEYNAAGAEIDEEQRIQQEPQGQQKLQQPIPQPIPQSRCPLDELQCRFLQCMLYGQPYGELLKANGLMLSVIVDSINESLFDTFSDTVILFHGDTPELIEDYIDELKGMIPQ